MDQQGKRQPIVLAVVPCYRGIAFVTFSGPWLPIDWGIKWTEADNPRGVRAVRELIDGCRPDVLVFEDYGGEGSRRGKRIETLLDAIKELAREKKIATRQYSRAQIRDCFVEDGAFTKYEIAQIIAQQYPRLVPLLPPKRKIWLAEHPNMYIFDACSFALTYFCHLTLTNSAGKPWRRVRSWVAAMPVWRSRD